MPRAPDQGWRRLRAGDDPVIDGYLVAQVEVLHERLEAANNWRDDGRRYRLDPPIPRGSSTLMYEVDAVSLLADERRGRWLRAQRALIAAGVLWVILTCTDAAMTIGDLLLDLFRP